MDFGRNNKCLSDALCMCYDADVLFAVKQKLCKNQRVFIVMVLHSETTGGQNSYYFDVCG